VELCTGEQSGRCLSSSDNGLVHDSEQFDGRERGTKNTYPGTTSYTPARATELWNALVPAMVAE
jgi:hypothetical protein